MRFKSKKIDTEKNHLLTPYQLAKQEWDLRIGSSREQAKNWRLIALLALLITTFSSLALLSILPLEKNKIFVAEITKEGRVINVAPLLTIYKPTLAQEEYFLSNFIKLVRGLSLDPVAAKQNWLNSYHFLTSRGASLLNEYFRQNNPVNMLGKQTVVVDITDINPLSEFTFNVQWIETTFDNNGQTAGTKNFSSVFTIVIQTPKTQAKILENPLGIYINDFHISERV